MNDIQLEQLRDFAIEYLPAAQKERDNFKQWERMKRLTPRDYAASLAALTIPLHHKASLLAVERAAASLLYAVTMWQAYDPNAPELADIDHAEYRADSMRAIADAAETLQTITGRDIAHLIPPETRAAKGKDTTPGDDWTEQARAIADECFNADTKAGCRDSLKGYSKRVMELMQQRGIKGSRGIIDNSNYVMREALQSDFWWKNKLK